MPNLKLPQQYTIISPHTSSRSKYQLVLNTGQLLLRICQSDISIGSVLDAPGCDAAKQAVQAAENIAHSSETLAHLAENLETLLGKFKV